MDANPQTGRTYPCPSCRAPLDTPDGPAVWRKCPRCGRPSRPPASPRPATGRRGLGVSSWAGTIAGRRVSTAVTLFVAVAAASFAQLDGAPVFALASSTVALLAFCALTFTSPARASTKA